jgi:cupin fold WbuC family metalloprotein
MKIIDKNLLDEVSAQAKASPRLRMNFNFHQSLDDKCHRMLNAVEPGTVVAIFICGKTCILFYNWLFLPRKKTELC